MVKTDKDKVTKPKPPQTGGETVLPLNHEPPPPMQMAALQEYDGPKLGERPMNLGMDAIPTDYPMMQGPQFQPPIGTKPAQPNLPAPGDSPDYMRLKASLDQMDAPPKFNLMKELFGIAGGINFMDPAQFQNLQQRKIGEEFDQQQTKRQNIVNQMQGIKSGERQAALDSEAAELRNYERSRRPVQEQMDAVNLQKATAPARPQQTDEFVNAEGRKVYRVQQPDGQFTYEEAPYELPQTPRNIDPLSEEGIAAQTRLANSKPQSAQSADQEWVTRNGVLTPIRKGTAQPGDAPYDAVAARQAPGASGPSDYAVERATRTIASVDSLKNSITTNGRWVVGGLSNFLAALPETEARSFRTQLDTLKSNIATNELTAMREASKTGGALGNVSTVELKLLESALGGLDTAQSPKQFNEQLDKIKGSVERWQAAQKNTAVGAGNEYTIKPGSATGPKVGDEEDGHRFLGGDPSDPSRWEPIESPAPESVSGTLPESLRPNGQIETKTANLPTRNNNPLNIKYGAATKQWVDQGLAELAEAGQDGGQFLKFDSPDTGFIAARTLLSSPVYSGLTVDAAMKKWSNSGYSAREIAPEYSGMRIAQLSDEAITSIIKRMAKREGYSGNTD